MTSIALGLQTKCPSHNLEFSQPHDDDEELAELVASAAARIAIELNDPAVGRDDVVQELRIRLLRGMANHQPSQGDRRRFATMLIKRERVTLLRARYAQKRRGKCVGDAAVLAQQQSTSFSARTADDPANEMAQHLDVSRMLQTLPSDAQRLAKYLMTHSVAEVARRTGIPRTTLQEQLRSWRRPFEEAGLRDYLK